MKRNVFLQHGYQTYKMSPRHCTTYNNLTPNTSHLIYHVEPPIINNIDGQFDCPISYTNSKHLFTKQHHYIRQRSLFVNCQDTVFDNYKQRFVKKKRELYEVKT